jgi:single-stranded-DNA-specific exonuclease
MMMHLRSEKKWRFRNPPADYSESWIKKMGLELGIPEIIVRLLAFRDIQDKKVIHEFLAPALAQLPRPHLMKGMNGAVAIIIDAIKSQHPITVFGDFDADGITATSVLTLFLNELGTPAEYYIPDRLSEGYGLNSEAVRKIYENRLEEWGSCGVLLTADCGISDVDVIDEAKRLGFKVIITDHHRPPDRLPKADIILNPQQPDCGFPCKNLAGVGVAFYLILGLRTELMRNGHWPEEKIPNLKSYMDLVAIGTVADQVPVTGCNRIIIKAGLEVLNMTGRIGLWQLLDNTRNNGREVSSEDIAFRLAPRINAVGRIGSADLAVKLMTTDSRKKAEQLAGKLEEANNARKDIEASIFAEAAGMVSRTTLETANSLVLYKNDWHLGILGIVASRLSDQFHRPVILLTDCIQTELNGSISLIKGSGRSIDGIDIHAVITSCQDLLSRFGGHSGAVGLTLSKDNLESFRERFDNFISAKIAEQSLIPTLLIDMQITLNDLKDQEFFAAYSSLSPFGTGNPEPVFCLNSQKLSNQRLVGANHLKFTLRADGQIMNGIGFGLGSMMELSQNNLVDLAFTLRLNTYQGKNNWEINLVDLRQSGI